MNAPDRSAPERTGRPRSLRARGSGVLVDARESWLELVGGRVRDKPWLPDALVVGALICWIFVSSASLGTGEMFLGFAMVLPLWWRRSSPLVVALVIAGICLLQVLVLDHPHPGNIAVPLAIYSAAAFGSRAVSRAVLWLGLLGVVLASLDWSTSAFGVGQRLLVMTSQAVFLAMFVGVAWVLGDVVRRRKAVVGRLQAQNRALARDQEQRAKLAAQSERAAIAREMHDVVAHSLAVVVVQADGALYAARAALDAPPAIGADRAALERAATTLQTLGETARASLADTRRLVGVLRDEGAGAEYSPLQGLAHLEDLVDRVRHSGVPVQLAARGRVDDLPRDVDLAAYRVVQESLTNAMKHAGPGATVDVDVLRTPSVLLVRVTDDGTGPGPDADGEGNGLLGMAERVEVLGGTVHAGPRGRTRGWEVVASIPVEPLAPEPAPDLAGDRDGIPSWPAPISGGDQQ